MKISPFSIFLISSLLFICCQNGNTITYIGGKTNIDTTSNIIGRMVVLDHSKLNTSVSNYKYNVLYSFNANCSSCIVELINVLKKYNSHRGKSYDSTGFYFFAITENPEQLKYYLKENNVEFNANEFLVFDSLESFYSKNSGIFQSGTINTILTNNKFQVLEKDDPFSSEQAKESYQNAHIFQNIKLNN